MHPAVYIVGAIIALLGFLLSALVGYYKARSEFSDKLKTYVSKDDCQKCSIKTEVNNVINDIKQITKDLKEGTQLFAHLRIGMAVIKTKLGIKSDLDELKKMVFELENRRDGT